MRRLFSFDRGSRVRNGIDFLASIAMLVTAGVLLWNNFGRPYMAQRARNPIPKQTVSLGGTVKGSQLARVAIIEYSDFECPFCGAFSRQRLGGIEKMYITPGRVQLAFKHRPLTIHKSAEGAARAAACASKQGQFWVFHDALFRRQNELSDATFSEIAAEHGLDEKAFEACQGDEGRQIVEGDAREAAALQINGTPTFLIGRIELPGQVRVTDRVSGSPGDGVLEKILDRLLSR